MNHFPDKLLPPSFPPFSGLLYLTNMLCDGHEAMHFQPYGDDLEQVASLSTAGESVAAVPWLSMAVNGPTRTRTSLPIRHKRNQYVLQELAGSTVLPLS